MIEMPRRSVTRFFIPLIDVLMLLFGIFLLMPIATEAELEGQRDTASDQAETADALQRELRRRTHELRQLEELRPMLDKVAELKNENDRLRNQARQGIQQRFVFKIIDIDPKTGVFEYADPLLPEKKAEQITDKETARALIERHQREIKGRELAYVLRRPRQLSGYPTGKQIEQLRQWFAGVQNSVEQLSPDDDRQ